ncbi:Rrf2 family transcriptional regulator [Yeosuana sp. MJ-SS3]|jgi:Rrf2 family protein|uniref:Rrf2 family transcriptional regulator n=1 Tax=Gilvirhabdus luticola TaxID=3079858 RepID=A0ABU3U7V8_9FLAO|nr:Rrf2 family transcriptional regulator [Yeosuana sp. MJ-SS3]MDU8886494.1 Rrf2 family transcriptional regulator [Yeosuana sp. MJ-SS3]
MFSNSVKYALKAVLYLAIHSSEDKKIMVKELNKPINVPKAYIAKLLQELSKQNIISSTRGIKGGFYLTKENSKQNLMNVIYAIDGDYRMKSCMLSLSHCNQNKPCPLHHIVSPMRDKLIEAFNKKTIKELSLEIEKGITFLPI